MTRFIVRSAAWLSCALLPLVACEAGRKRSDDDGRPSTVSTGGAAGSGGAGMMASSNASTVMSASSSTTGGGVQTIGETCASNADCGAGLRCLRPIDDSLVLSGGAPGGYCTKDCTTDGDCPSGSSCITNQNGQGECYLDCVLGPPLMFVDDALSPSKCHGREDARCTALQNGYIVCLPVCGMDSQCGARVCDPRTSLCQDAANTGSPHGTACNDTAPNEDGCAGICQPFSTGFGVCTTTCSLGGMPVEMQPDCNGLSGGICLFSPAGNGAGDWGVCSPNCALHTDCPVPDLFCRSTTYAPASTGYCIGATECPNGQADCAALAPPPTGYDWTCTVTPYGSYCLETDPLNGNQLVFPIGP